MTGITRLVESRRFSDNRKNRGEKILNDQMVSIVIPCYKQAKLLTGAVRSCLDQTHPLLEIIVVDDGSPDDVKGALQPFGNRIKLIKQENQGLAAARNTGLQAVNGKYVKFLDADDWLLPNCVEQQFKSLKGLSGYISVVGYRFHFDDSERKDEDVFPNFGKFSHALCYINTGPPHTFLFPTEMVRNLGGFNTGSLVDGGHEDYELLCRLASQGIEAAALHIIGCVYRQTKASMSRQLGKMQRTRSGVWISYAENLMKQDCSLDLLVHLIGGYVLRLKSDDFRYQATHILTLISEKISELEAVISQATAILLSQKLTHLLKHLPSPDSLQDRKQRDLHLKIVENLTDKILLRITPDFFLEADPLLSLIDLANAHMEINRNRYGRKVLTHSLLISPPNFFLKSGLFLLKFLSFILPGKLAVSIWRCLRNVYEIFPLRFNLG